MRKIIIFLLLFSYPNYAEDPFQDFRGQFHVSGKSVIDTPNGEPGNTHMYLRLKGEAAKIMYNMIKNEQTINKCGIDHISKQSGNIQCDYFEKTDMYYCQFSVDVNNSKIGPGGSC